MRPPFRSGYRNAIMALRPLGYWPMRTSASVGALDETRRAPFALVGAASSLLESPVSDTTRTNSFSLAGSGNFRADAATSDHLGLTGDMTIVVWIKTSFTTAQHILGFYNVGPPFEGYGLATGSDFGSANDFYFWNGAAWNGSASLTGFNATDGAWHMLVFGLSGLIAHWWQDGVEQRSSGISGPPAAFSGPRGIGARGDDTARFTGNICELAIFNRWLGPSTVRDLWQTASAA